VMMSAGDPLNNPTTPSGGGAGPRLRYVQFSFPTEREARKFCQAYAPPKPLAGNACRVCDQRLTASNSSSHGGRHCRNCGVPLCERCSIRWGSRMIPKTYLVAESAPPRTVRVCKSCDWLSNAFCLSLLQGRYEDALVIHGTVRIDVRFGS